MYTHYIGLLQRSATYGLLRISEFCASDSINTQDHYKLLYLNQLQLWDKDSKIIATSNIKAFDKVSYYTIRLRSSKLIHSVKASQFTLVTKFQFKPCYVIYDHILDYIMHNRICLLITLRLQTRLHPLQRSLCLVES